LSDSQRQCAVETPVEEIYNSCSNAQKRWT